MYVLTGNNYEYMAIIDAVDISVYRQIGYLISKNGQGGVGYVKTAGGCMNL